MQDITTSEFMQEGNYLPEPMRDFHDQKNLFKSMSQIYGDPMTRHMPSWVDAHVFTVDYFLCIMATRGYTLQKCRKKGFAFKEWPKPDTSAMDAIIMGELKSVDDILIQERVNKALKVYFNKHEFSQQLRSQIELVLANGSFRNRDIVAEELAVQIVKQLAGRIEFSIKENI